MLKQGKAEVVHQTGFEGSIDFGDGFEAIEQMGNLFTVLHYIQR